MGALMGVTRLLGIDLGTSAVKAVVVDDAGRVVGAASAEIPMLTPASGWAEQRLEDWQAAATRAVRGALETAGATRVDGIGLSGQMHGTVLIDRHGRPLGPAIIWADQRAGSVLDLVTERIGREELVEVTGTLPAAGFMGPTLLWLKQHAADRLAAAQAVLLPKDALRRMLVPEILTDETDASGTGLFDVRRREWSGQVVAGLGLTGVPLPPVGSSCSVAGRLSDPGAEALGLLRGTPVALGCADQVAQAIGGGLLDPGVASITVGTGGQFFAPLDTPTVDPAGRLHTFCHALVDRWYMLGATLAAGLSLRWLRDLLGNLPYQDLVAMASRVPAGADGLFFLPFLVGERSPIMDPLAQGAFVGLELRHGRGHLVRAVLEGVAFSLRSTVEAAEEAGLVVSRLIAAGNGLGNRTWRQIVANVLGRPLHYRERGEQTALGAALIGGVAAGVFDTLRDAASRSVVDAPPTDPVPAEASVYDALFREYCQWVARRPRRPAPMQVSG